METIFQCLAYGGHLICGSNHSSTYLAHSMYLMCEDWVFFFSKFTDTQ